MPGIFIFILIVAIIICLFVNSSSSEAIETASNAVEEYNERVRDINQLQVKINDEFKVADGSVEHRNKVKDMLNEYIAKYNEIAEENPKVISCIENAQNKLNGHRVTQNLFLGGATDISALGYYSKEKKLNNISRIEKVEDHKQTLFLGKLYINDPEQFFKVKSAI